MAAIGNAARHGFLVREGDALERLAQVKRVAFDKTGTLTYGRPQVAAVKSFNNALTDDDLYLYTASVEKLSEHPLAQAVVASFAKKVLPADAFKMYAGRGVEGKVNGLKITAGNEKLFAAAAIRPKRMQYNLCCRKRRSRRIYCPCRYRKAGSCRYACRSKTRR